MAGIFGRAGNGKLGRLVEVGIAQIVQHDQRIIAAELERGTLVSGLRRDQLADPHAAGEGDDFDLRVGHHLIANIGRPAGDHLEHFRRQSRFIEDVGQGQRRKRRQFGRLADDAGLTAIAGATLCDTMLSGWLNGVIAETTRTGSRS